MRKIMINVLLFVCCLAASVLAYISMYVCIGALEGGGAEADEMVLFYLAAFPYTGIRWLQHRRSASGTQTMFDLLLSAMMFLPAIGIITRIFREGYCMHAAPFGSMSIVWQAVRWIAVLSLVLTPASFLAEYAAARKRSRQPA